MRDGRSAIYGLKWENERIKRSSFCRKLLMLLVILDKFTDFPNMRVNLILKSQNDNQIFLGFFLLGFFHFLKTRDKTMHLKLLFNQNEKGFPRRVKKAKFSIFFNKCKSIVKRIFWIQGLSSTQIRIIELLCLNCIKKVVSLWKQQCWKQY